MSPAKLQDPPCTHLIGDIYVHTHADRGVYTGMVKNMETTTLFRVQGPCALNLVYMAPRERKRDLSVYIYICVYTYTHAQKTCR